MKLTDILIPILLFTYQAKCISQESALDISANYGKYSVGFKTFYEYDRTRSFSIDANRKNVEKGKTIYRPMQVCVWYPAANSGKSNMKYRDYFFLKAHETGKINLTEEQKTKIIEKFVKDENVDKATLLDELNKSMRGIKDAPTNNKEKFPVIVYGPSWWSTAFENELLFEFLASHGYVVVSSPSMGPIKRDMPISRIGVETQAKDMEFLLGFMHGFPNADIDKVTVAGFSYGGLSNVIMAARNKSVDAWIGLDPSIHEKIYEYFEKSPYYDYSLFSIPMLFINTIQYMDYTLFYDKLIYSNAYVVDLPKLKHIDLASQFIKLYGSNDMNVKGYNIMASYVLDFLDGVFKKNYDYNKMKNIVFNDRDIDSSFIKIKSKKSIPTVDQILLAENENIFKNTETIISLLNSTIVDDFSSYPEKDLKKLIVVSSEQKLDQQANKLMEWYKQNYPKAFHKKVMAWVDYDKMLEMFINIYKTNGNKCDFTYDELNHTGHIFTMGERKQEGIEYFKLNVNLYPNSYKSHFNLGIGYIRLKNFYNAKISFTKSLELTPDDRYRKMAENWLLKL